MGIFYLFFIFLHSKTQNLIMHRIPKIEKKRLSLFVLVKKKKMLVLMKNWNDHVYHIALHEVRERQVIYIALYRGSKKKKMK